MKHLLGIDELSADQIDGLLDRAQYYADGLAIGKWDHGRLSGKVILHLFFEDSTRTLTSFEMAAKRLGADVINWNPETSSLYKGDRCDCDAAFGIWCAEICGGAQQVPRD